MHVDASPQGKVSPQSERRGASFTGKEKRAHHFCDFRDVLSVLPAGEHVGERQGLQTSVDKVRLRGRPLDIFSCQYTEGNVRTPRVCVRRPGLSLSSLEIFSSLFAFLMVKMQGMSSSS